MSNYEKSDLIDQDYAREHFEKEPYSFKLPIVGFNLCENISGIGHGTWTVFFVEADGDETDICRVISARSLRRLLSSLGLVNAWVYRVAEKRLCKIKRR